jgi:replicative DNA helicase
VSIAELPSNRAPRDNNISSIGADFERTPPQDLIAEQSVLGGMLLSKDAIADVIEIIRDRDFYRPAHELIYDAIIDLYGRGEPVDAVTVSSELTKRGDIARAGGAPYLHTLISSVPTAANAGYYAKIVREHAQAEVYAVTERRASEDYVQLSTLLPQALDEIEAISKGIGIEGVKSGFKDLDALTHGFHPGNMIILAARPAMGKSTLGLDIARHASIHEGQTSVIFSLEMSKSEITMRMLSAEARVGLNNIRAGTLSDDEWSRLARRMGEISEAPLFIDDSPNLSMMEIRAKARRLKQRHNLKLIVIDYLQLMSSGKKVENRQQEVSEFSRQLKLMAKELNIPVIAISQLNRSPEQRSDKKPMLSDLRESGSIEQDADVVILLHRDDMYDQQNRTGEADLIVAKHRNGPTRTITVSAQLHYARFYDMPQNPGGGQDWTQQREAGAAEDTSFGA